MSKTKVPFETATAEFEKWLNAKQVSKKRRENLADMEEEIIDAIMEGNLVLNKDIEFIQHLNFPNSKVSELKFQTRIQVGMINAKLRGIQANDVNGRLEAYISALTGEPVSLVKTLDSSDFAIASCIATYFL